MKTNCIILTTMDCEKCKFYKTVEQACEECTYSDCAGCVIYEQPIPKVEKK